MPTDEPACTVLHPTSLTDFLSTLTDILNDLKRRGCSSPTIELKVVGGGIQACACYALLYIKCNGKVVRCFEAPEPVIMQ
ncbi:MAG: hypothetical protein ABGW50_01590 [Thermococcus sp.]